MTGFSFFKIILREDLKKHLDLPKKFVRLHGDALSNTVFLKLPCGKQWNLGLLKAHGNVYLHQGWSKFANHYRLEYGHMLLFDYEGNSNFSVSICDMSTCEIEYPSIPAPSYGTPKRRRTSNEIKSEVLQEENKAEGSGFKKSENGSEETSISYKKSKAFEKAINFSSTNPFFRKVMRSNRNASYNMRLPANFANGYLERKNQIVELQVGMNSWSVKLLKCPSGYFISGGWSTFVSENSLLPGDVCIYELIKRKEAVLKVHIFKRNGA